MKKLELLNLLGNLLIENFEKEIELNLREKRYNV